MSIDSLILLEVVLLLKKKMSNVLRPHFVFQVKILLLGPMPLSILERRQDKNRNPLS